MALYPYTVPDVAESLALKPGFWRQHLLQGGIPLERHGREFRVRLTNGDTVAARFQRVLLGFDIPDLIVNDQTYAYAPRLPVLVAVWCFLPVALVVLGGFIPAVIGLLAAMANLGFIAEAQLALRGEGEPRRRFGNELFGAFGRDFACRDGERVMVVGLTFKQWQSLRAATALAAGMDALGARLGLDLSKEGHRFGARLEIAAQVGDWIGARDFADVAATFDRHGVCWGRYQTLEQLVRDDPSCSTANPMFTTVEQPGVGELLANASPMDFSALERVPAQAAPQLGEHTAQVLHELLGIEQAAYSRLRDSGVAGG